jgi:hypothetical protein
MNRAGTAVVAARVARSSVSCVSSVRGIDAMTDHIDRLVADTEALA